MNKSAIRQIYTGKRLKLEAKEVQEKSQMVANNFIKNLLPSIADFAGKKLAFYVAANNEIDPIFIINHCRKLGNIISLPKIIPGRLILDFKLYENGDELIPNSIYPKLLEPRKQSQDIIPDIIFMPLTAFDKNCNRVGMGGGFYDATIMNLKKQNHHLTLIGLAYAWQEFPEIPSEILDEKLDYIISENQIISRNQ
jgi:5-formyltetrahydrofolate cyclo-ligase